MTGRPSEAVADPDIRAMVLEGFFPNSTRHLRSAFGADRRKANCRKSADPFVLGAASLPADHPTPSRSRGAAPRVAAQGAGKRS